MGRQRLLSTTALPHKAPRGWELGQAGWEVGLELQETGKRPQGDPKEPAGFSRIFPRGKLHFSLDEGMQVVMRCWSGAGLKIKLCGFPKIWRNISSNRAEMGMATC